MIIEIPEYRQLNQEARKSLREQIYYVNEDILHCVLLDDVIELDVVHNSKIDPSILTNEIKSLVSNISRSFQRVASRIVFQNKGSGNNSNDPYDNLCSSGQAMLISPGMYAFQGQFLSLIMQLDKYFREYAVSLGSIEHFYPTLVPTRSLLENGYLKNFPQHAYLVASARHDLNVLEVLGSNTDSINNDDLYEVLGPHSHVLAPTVCYHCFETLRNQVVPVDGAIYTAVSACNRYESHNVDGLTRLQNFTMREIIFFGCSEDVEIIRKRILDHCRSTLVNWGISFRIVTASDPFFSGPADSKRIFQSVMEVKYEVQAYLPHSDSWVSIASFNNHLQSLVGHYEIDIEGDNPLFSGCVGYGYERLAYAICSQYGLDRRDWPLAMAGRRTD